MALNNTPPLDNEIEVSLFGPGVGECICIHLGNKKWILVDSCLNPETKKPASLEYLMKMGVNLVDDVELIIITHWHDDHVHGMAQVVEACTNASVVLSSAFLKEEFLDLINIKNTPPENSKSGVSELSKVIHIVSDRIKCDKQNTGAPRSPRIKLAKVDSRLYMNNGIEVWSLSPSDAAVYQSHLEVKKLLKPDQISRRLVPLSANLNAVALWIETESCNILLGADLESDHSQSHLTGWQAVVNSTTKPNGKATIFKVPHHGSITGHHPDVWTNMVIQNPISILTTFSRSKLPNNSDIERIKQLSGSLYQTTIISPKPPARGKVVDQFMKQIAKKRIVKSNILGHIQARALSGDFIVELNSHAKKIL